MYQAIHRPSTWAAYPGYPRGATVVNNDFAVILTALAANLREKVCEAIIVIHRPTVERVIMTLGALDAHPHENLHGILHQFLGVALDLIKIAGGVAEGATLGAEYFLNDLVHRPIFFELRA